MTVNEAIRQADSLQPNPYEPAEKVRWLSALDGQIWLEVLATHAPAGAAFSGYDPAEDLDIPLLVEESHSHLYPLYLLAQMDFFNGEMERYNNSMVMYNMEYRAFTDWHTRTYRPGQPNYVRTSL